MEPLESVAHVLNAYPRLSKHFALLRPFVAAWHAEMNSILKKNGNQLNRTTLKRANRGDPINPRVGSPLKGDQVASAAKAAAHSTAQHWIVECTTV